MKKIFIMILFLFLLAAGAVYFFGESWIEGAVERRIREGIDSPVEIESLEIDPAGSFEIRGLRVMNREPYEGTMFLDIPLIRGTFDPRRLAVKRVIDAMEIRVSVYHIVDREGVPSNIESRSDGDEWPLTVTRLELRLETIRYTALAGGMLDVEQEFEVDIERHYRNVRGFSAIEGLIGFEALSHAGVARLLGVTSPVDFIEQNILDPAVLLGDMLTDTLKDAGSEIAGLIT